MRRDGPDSLTQELALHVRRFMGKKGTKNAGGIQPWKLLRKRKGEREPFEET